MGKGPFMILIDGSHSTSTSCMVGIFSSLPLTPIGDSKTVTINNSDNHFLFYYQKDENELTCHYQTNYSSDTETFLKFNFNDDNNEYNELEEKKGWTIWHKEGESPSGSKAKGNISFGSSSTEPSFLDFYMMKNLDSDSKQIAADFPYDFRIKGIEYWLMETNPTSSNKMKNGGISLDGYTFTNNIIDISHSYFRKTPVYKLPGNLKFKKMKEMILPQNSNCLSQQFIGTIDGEEV